MHNLSKVETRIIPEEVPAKFYAEHLKPYEFLSASIKDKKVLELGCGDGYGSAYLAKFARTVIGVDYEGQVILQAQNKYKASNLEFIPMDATRLKFEDNYFDIICSFQVIEHIPEDKLSGYLLEIKRVLKPGGAFYLSTLNLEHVMKSPLTYQKNAAHCKEFNLPELEDLLRAVFFNVEIYGLHLTLKHSFFQRLKKIGIFNFLPDSINPVSRFYSDATTRDFRITKMHLRQAIDFICVCGRWEK